MKVVFFGTPEFASRTLEKILASAHQVVGVVSAPDRPRGRGRKLEYPPVKKLALNRNLDIYQPENLKDPAFLDRLKSSGADFFCVVAFRILPEDVFEMPSLGCVNLHASLLPRYRGAAPINWAIINGERETGLTTFYIRKKVDTGDIILQTGLAIGPDETFGELHDRMAEDGSVLMLKTMDSIESGSVKTWPQNDQDLSSAPKIYPGMGKIDWSKSYHEIHNLVRGLSPRPGAYTFANDKKITILRTRIIGEIDSDLKPGTLAKADPKEGMIVACGDGGLEILWLKPASGKTISGAEFVRGHRLETGVCFGG